MSKIVTDLSILRQKSIPVITVAEAQDLIKKVESALLENKNGMGVAAIQLGVPKKIAVVRDSPGNFVYLINSELEEGIDEITYLNEGCLSLPGYFQNTKRYKQITIKNQVIDGDAFREVRQVFYYPQGKDDNFGHGDPLTCIAVQHEIEHFNGGLILDHNVTLEPFIKVPKVGRNDPCPCGSKKNNGLPKKYKHCCGS